MERRSRILSVADTDIEDIGESGIAWEVCFNRIFIRKAGLVAADGYADALRRHVLNGRPRSDSNEHWEH